MTKWQDDQIAIKALEAISIDGSSVAKGDTCYVSNSLACDLIVSLCAELSSRQRTAPLELVTVAETMLEDLFSGLPACYVPDQLEKFEDTFCVAGPLKAIFDGKEVNWIEGPACLKGTVGARACSEELSLRQLITMIEKAYRAIFDTAPRTRTSGRLNSP